MSGLLFKIWQVDSSYSPFPSLAHEIQFSLNGPQSVS